MNEQEVLSRLRDLNPVPLDSVPDDDRLRSVIEAGARYGADAAPTPQAAIIRRAPTWRRGVVIAAAVALTVLVTGGVLIVATRGGSNSEVGTSLPDVVSSVAATSTIPESEDAPPSTIESAPGAASIAVPRGFRMAGGVDVLALSDAGDVAIVTPDPFRSTEICVHRLDLAESERDPTLPVDTAKLPVLVDPDAVCGDLAALADWEGTPDEITQLRISPDNAWAVFSNPDSTGYIAGGGGFERDIYGFDLRSGELVNFTDEAGDDVGKWIADYEPTWLDATTVVFARVPVDSGAGLYLLDVETNEVSLLAELTDPVVDNGDTLGLHGSAMVIEGDTLITALRSGRSQPVLVVHIDLNTGAVSQIYDTTGMAANLPEADTSISVWGLSATDLVLMDSDNAGWAVDLRSGVVTSLFDGAEFGSLAGSVLSPGIIAGRVGTVRFGEVGSESSAEIIVSFSDGGAIPLTTTNSTVFQLKNGGRWLVGGGAAIELVSVTQADAG